MSLIEVQSGQAKSSTTLSYMSDIFALTKPTITLLVLVTVLPSMFVAVSHLPPISLVLACLGGTWFMSSSAAIFNHFIDMNIDQQMNRTRKRPVASGRVERVHAFAVGSIFGLIGFLVLFFAVNPLTAWIALSANVFYVCVYTAYLKKATAQNIVIGGAAGAVGPLIGWAAVTGGLGWEAWFLFAIIFLWTPPHFWSLAIKYKDDYIQAGIPMMPGVVGDVKTKWQMLWYSIVLIPVIVALGFSPMIGAVFVIGSSLLTIYFVFLTIRLLKKNQDSELLMPYFHFSCLYMFGIFGFLIVDNLLLRLI